MEKSVDGRSFGKEATIAASGSNAAYYWLDENVLQQVNFYRIKSTDASGQIKYSPVVKIKGNENSGNIVISPNPVAGNEANISFTVKKPGNYCIKIVNAGGQAVYTKTVICNTYQSAMQKIIIPHGMAKGAYEVLVSAPDGYTTTAKLLIAGE